MFAFCINTKIKIQLNSVLLKACLRNTHIIWDITKLNIKSNERNI